MTCGVAHLGFSGLLSFCIILQAILADRCRSPVCFVLANLCGFLLGKYFMMSSRSTRNSQSSALDALSIAVLAESSCASVIADLAANPPGPSAAAPRAVAAVVVQQDQPSPAFLATVVQAVKDALAAERAPARSVLSASSQPSTATMLGGVPVSSSNPAYQASAFLPLARALFCYPPLRAQHPKVGLVMLCPPLFLLFRFPHLQCLFPRVLLGLPRQQASSLSSLPALQQPFVVGLGFSPIPAKLVGQIVAGKFVDLSELLSSNIASAEPEPQLYFEGRLVLTFMPKKPKRRIEDITSWLEAFSIYCLILASHFPHRWKDLMNYQLLILRTHRQFTGRVWFAYDHAFREHAAATNLTDWSSINVQLFNFHAAGAAVRASNAPVDGSPEPRGSASSTIVCKSWNRGRCVAPYASCRFAHTCSSCSGPHRVSACPGQTPNQPKDTVKRRSSSTSRSRSKSRRL